MNVDAACAVLNQNRHRGSDRWHRFASLRSETFVPFDDSPSFSGLSEFEVVAIAEKYVGEAERLRAAIVKHRSQKADDRCIEDDDELYAALRDGIQCDRRVGDKAAMLQNCARFIERRCEEGGWPSYAELEAEVLRLTQLVDTPHTSDFMTAVPLEAAHQIKRWGTDHDAGKTPWDWFWLVGYLSQKAAQAATEENIEKAKHHTISTAAAMLNWFRRLTGDDSTFQQGADRPED